MVDRLKPKDIRHYHVFIASPGDMGDERQAVRDFFSDFNRNHANAWGAHFEIIDWENYATTGVGRPQELITRKTLEEHQESLVLFVGLMGRRFGSSTGKSESGTEEELEWARASHRDTGFPEIKFFFRKVDPCEIPQDPDSVEQWEKVCSLRQRFNDDKSLFYREFDTGKFESVLRNDLTRWLTDPQRPWHRQPTSAFSVFPSSRHPWVDLELIGRDTELEWLRTTSGDRLIFGKPGCGKSFLLYHFVREGSGLFLASSDPTEIVNGVRDRGLAVVVVDDAHKDPGFLGRLVQLRRENEAEFAIVATSWEGARHRIAEELERLASPQILELGLLTRDEIVKVLRRAGIDAHPDHMMELVDLADGKPGLAVTLADLWKQGAWPDIFEARAVARSLSVFFDQYVGADSTQIIAAFSMGGDRGMKMTDVGDYLGLGRGAIHEKLLSLAAGGVLTEAGKDTYSIWPRQLRSAFLREIFFRDDGMGLKDYHELLERAPSFDKAVLTLIDAKSRNVAVPSEELRDLVARCESKKIWEAFTWLGRDEAAWALAHYPKDWLDIAQPALHRDPETMVPRLLQRATEETNAVYFLRTWATELRISTEEGLRRRQLLSNASKSLLKEGPHGVGMEALCLALSPVLQDEGADPGAGMSIWFRRAVPRQEEVGKFEEIWREARRAITTFDSRGWRAFESLLRDLIEPGDFVTEPVPDEIAKHLRSMAEHILVDLVPVIRGSPGLTMGFQRLAARMELVLPLENELEFELLYTWGASADLREHELALDDLAEQWVGRPPLEVGRQLLRYETEAHLIGKTSRAIDLFCRLLAEKSDQPEIGLDVFLELDLGSRFVRPFLSELVRIRRDGWEDRLERCLELETYREIAVQLLLETSDPPPFLLDRAFEKLALFPETVYTVCLWQSIPLSTLERLLRHPSKEVAFAAAAGEWTSSPRGEIRPGFEEAWNQVVREYQPTGRNTSLDYWIAEILESDSNIALDWLLRHLGDLHQFALPRGIFISAIEPLDRSQRAEILNELTQAIPPWSIRRLVARDLELYRRLLSLEALRAYHLVPLEGLPDDEWIALAMFALEAGYHPQKVAEASFEKSVTGWGIRHWTERQEAFEALESHEYPGLREAARWGRERASRELRFAEERKRNVSR